MSDRKQQKAVERKQKLVERQRKLRNRWRRIQYRLRDRVWASRDRPMFTAANIHYELADRVRGLGPGGIGSMHLLARRGGLVKAIDRRLHVPKIHLPYPGLFSAPCKGVDLQWVQFPPGKGSLQPVAIGAVMEVTNRLKLSMSKGR